MVRITNVHARQVLDSRGNPTVEAEVRTARGFGRAIVPSGASTGIHEAIELRDKTAKYNGKGVSKAVKNINTIIKKKIVGKTYTAQKDLDKELINLDGTPNKSKLGVNAILAVSMAFARARSTQKLNHLHETIAEDFKTLKNESLKGLGKSKRFSKNEKQTLPVPFSNVINGGVHAGNELEMQEFMIAPVKAKSFSEGVRIVAETYHELKHDIGKKYGKNAVNVGDEGGFAPPVKNAEEALDLLVKTMDKVGYTNELRIAMDAAASEFYNKKSHSYLKKKLLPEQMQKYYEKLLKNYPIISLEDPFDQDDFKSWKKMTAKSKVQIVGDDLTVTNPARVQMSIEEELCNSLLLKVNQIGTLTESLVSARLALDADWTVMVSHRSGETEDSFIADLAVGLGVGQIKLGAPCRSDRVAKYNQLLRIEEQMGKKAKYARWK